MRLRGGRIAAITVVVAAVSALLVLTARQSPAMQSCAVVAGPTSLPAIPEASGLAVSRRDPSRLWSHNDSGNAAVLFALDTMLAHRGTVRVPVRTRDWEDISAGTCPSGVCLYLADIGDNARTRESIQIYRIQEPLPGEKNTAAPEVLTATYADGPHDAEAMFVIGLNLFIITKDRTGGVYQAALSGGRTLTLLRIGQLGLRDVTDAEAAPDEEAVVVRTAGEVAVYPSDVIVKGGHTASFRTSVAWLREPQGEGVAMQGPLIHLSSEGGGQGMPGRLVTLRCAVPH